MYLLSICIPNYNREEKLKRLLNEIIYQIEASSLMSLVSVCISDDCSLENPEEMVLSISARHPDVSIKFNRNAKNEGMDRNFLNSVLMADSEYCWIVGNDDNVEKNGLITAVELLKENVDLDFIVSPFDIYSDDGEYLRTMWPLFDRESRIYDTSNDKEKAELLFDIIDNSGIFGFLSNVIVRKNNWETRKDLFVDKMNSIFIQMYINIDTVLCGCKYMFTDKKLIVNQIDTKTNQTIDRKSRILFGLDDVAEFFFDGDVKRHFKRILTDAYLVSELWELPEYRKEKEQIKQLDSEKNEIYKRFYIPIINRKELLNGRRVVIYGAGKYGELTLSEVVKYSGIVDGIADSSKEKQGTTINGLVVISPEEMIARFGTDNVMFLVANHSCLPEMVDLLLCNHISDIGVLV